MFVYSHTCFHVRGCILAWNYFFYIFAYTYKAKDKVFGWGCHKKRCQTRISWTETVKTRKNYVIRWTMKHIQNEDEARDEQEKRCTWILSLGESSEMFNILQEFKIFLNASDLYAFCSCLVISLKYRLTFICVLY